MKPRLEIGLQLFSSSFGRVVFLRIGFTCVHLHLHVYMFSGNKPEQSDAFIMYRIGITKTSRHAFSSMVGSGSRSQDILGDDMIICLTSMVVAGSNNVS